MSREIHELVRFPASDKLFRAGATALDAESRFKISFSFRVRIESVRVGRMIVACSDAHHDLAMAADRNGVDVLAELVTGYECRVIVRRGERVLVAIYDPQVRTTATFDWTPVSREASAHG